MVFKLSPQVIYQGSFVVVVVVFKGTEGLGMFFGMFPLAALRRQEQGIRARKRLRQTDQRVVLEVG